MEGKRVVDTNLGILLICLFSAVFTMADFIIIDHVLDKYVDYSKCQCDKCDVPDDGVISDTPIINNGIKNNYEVITQDELVGLIDEQLYIFYGKKSLNDISNQSKLSLSLHLMGNDNLGELRDSFTSKELEEFFNSSIISNLGIKHENIIPSKSILIDGNMGYGYTYSNDVYSDPVRTNSGYSSVHMIYNKVVSFNENEGQYTFSIKYLWGGFGEYLMDDESVYGKYVDSINGQNSIGVVPEDILMGSYEQLQNWGKDNFSNFEDKLEKYNFVFVKKNGKINLIDFYVD